MGDKSKVLVPPVDTLIVVDQSIDFQFHTLFKKDMVNLPGRRGMSQQPNNINPYPENSPRKVPLAVVPKNKAVQDKFQKTGNLSYQLAERRLSSALVRLFAIDLVTIIMSVSMMYFAAGDAARFTTYNLDLIFPMNILLFFGLGFWCRLYELHKSRYIIGQFLIIGLVMIMANVLFFSMYGLSGMTQGLILGAFCILAIPSLCAHHHYSFNYSMSDRKNLFYRIEIMLKQSFDISVSLLGLLAILPLTLFTALAIRLESEGNPLYSQIRVGLNKKRFRLYKFRSMWVGERRSKERIKNRPNPKVLFKSEHDPRITFVGKIIRKLSIDELPQLLNVIRGEMSLVGPRPPLESEFEEMNAHHRRKFEALPGLTGLWQITGRVYNEREFDQVAEYDVAYIENWSLFYDLLILFRTIPVVLLQKGAC